MPLDRNSGKGDSGDQRSVQQFQFFAVSGCSFLIVGREFEWACWSDVVWGRERGVVLWFPMSCEWSSYGVIWDFLYVLWGGVMGVIRITVKCVVCGDCAVCCMFEICVELFGYWIVFCGMWNALRGDWGWDKSFRRLRYFCWMGCAVSVALCGHHFPFALYTELLYSCLYRLGFLSMFMNVWFYDPLFQLSFVLSQIRFGILSASTLR